jgi:hypothetical protein
MVDFFTSMSMEQFDEYILNLFELNQSDNKQLIIATNDINANETLGDVITPNASTSNSQRYYYTGTNFLYITPIIQSIGRTYVYYSIPEYGQEHTHNTFPYYEPSLGFSYSFSTSQTQAYCSFSCVKYLAQYITDGVRYNINVTFTAGAGDIYPGA